MEPDQKPAAPDGSLADAQGADYNSDEGHATDLALPNRDRNPLTRVSCWACQPRLRRPCACLQVFGIAGLEFVRVFGHDVVIHMMTTRPPKTLVEPTAFGPVANTDTKLLIYQLFQKG